MEYFGFKDILDYSLSIPNFYAYEYDYFNMSFHSHMSAEIMYAENGECDILISSLPAKLHLKKGQFVFINSRVAHKLNIQKGKRCKILNLELAPSKGSLNFYSLLDSSLRLKETFLSFADFAVFNDTAGVSLLINQLHSELASDYKAEKNLRLNALVLELLVAITRCYDESLSQNNKYVAFTIEFIKQNFSSDISSKTIAKAANLNPLYYQRLIKTQTGKTPLTLITEYRITNAKKLIENTHLSLTDIAFHCGYNSRQNFYEAFKKSQKLSPAEYKKQVLAKTRQSFRQTDFETE